MKALEYLLNFKTNKASINDANGSVKTLKESVLGVGSAINSVHSDLSKFASSQKWANIASLSSNVFSSVGNIASSVKKAFSASFDFVADIAASGDKISKTAHLVGLSVKDYQGFQFAAERSGLSLETLDSALKKFNVTLGKAKSGDATAGKYFEALLPKDVSEYENSKDVILDIADAYKKLSAEERAMVSQDVFGRSGLQMAELFAGGAAGVQDLLDQFDSLGGGFSEEAAKQAEKFDDDLLDMQKTFGSMKILLGSSLIPLFSKLFKTITDYFVQNKDSIQKSVSSLAETLMNGIQAIIPRIPEILSGLQRIFEIVGDIVEFIGPIKSIFAVGILGSLGSIVPLVTSLVGLIGGPAVAAIGAVATGIAAWGTVFNSVYKNWDMMVSSFHDFENWLRGTKLGKLMDFISGSKVDFDSVTAEEDAAMAALKPSVKIPGAVKAASSSTTTTSRFAVDFNNTPPSVTVTAPQTGDFDYSVGYTLGGF